MRLRVSRNSAEEQLTQLLNDGYSVRSQIWNDYAPRRQNNSYSIDSDLPRYRKMKNDWGEQVRQFLVSIFPTDLEWNMFSAQESHTAMLYSNMDQDVGTLYHADLPMYLNRLKSILETDLQRYTDLPLSERMYVEDIDSFFQVRDVNPGMVAHRLNHGYLDLTEDEVQIALEQILAVPFHKKDWGGELCDMYTANVTVNSQRRSTAFLLKGPGIGRKEMTIADCGSNGDQIVRLFTMPAVLFVIQYVGPMAELLVSDAIGKVRQLRAEGRDANLLMIDGQDTARLLHAYGKLPDIPKG